ncbi:MAG: AAA family ATPase [Clostridia bacterium]|nr:AAA family ATPase [Clostridia bacterium]
MKFLSCYIGGFGKFVNRSFDFSEGITVIKENNGWGKTTLAVFLKSMLFGLDGGRSKSLKNNERAKYFPWKGNVFGGSLTFSYQGAVYRVERTFGKTAAGDDVRVYDQNNSPCYVFGDKPMRLGELLFGLDVESYERSVYIPQGEVPTGELPDTMKNRLLSLLSTASSGEGAGRAVELLEKAERALQAKRKPGKGKIDLLDDRLLEIEQAKASSRQFMELAKETQRKLAETKERVQLLSKRKEELETVLGQEAAERETAARNAYVHKIQAEIAELEQRFSSAQEFFKNGQPDLARLNGVKGLIAEFYTLKATADEIEGKLREAQRTVSELTLWESKRDSAAKMLDSYRSILSGDKKTAGAGAKRNKNTAQFIAFGIAALFVLLGVAMFGVDALLGTVGVLVGGVVAVIGLALFKKPAKNTAADNQEIAKAYEECQAELHQAEQMLANIPQGARAYVQDLLSKQEQITALLQERKDVLDRFFAQFKLQELFDYRAAFATCQTRATEYAGISAELSNRQAALQNLDKMQFTQPFERSGEWGSLQAQKDGVDRELQEYLVYRERLQTELETYESRNITADLEAEENRLREEKSRLERRLFAVQAAKEIMLRAQENLATRYLDPVTKYCHQYLQTMGAGMGTLRFSADGMPLFEEDGMLRETAYYSEGMQGLVGFCTLIALVETMFKTERPCLILDDPFTDLDDEKTEQAKRFIRSLSERYQILYFTCKKERKL